MQADQLEQKRQIILQARKAVREGLSPEANPYPADSEAFQIWKQFYEMSYSDSQRQDLIHYEYEASAY